MNKLDRLPTPDNPSQRPQLPADREPKDIFRKTRDPPSSQP
jgi:hypothetical protein